LTWIKAGGLIVVCGSQGEFAMRHILAATLADFIEAL
jgi:hypothetical protein